MSAGTPIGFKSGDLQFYDATKKANIYHWVKRFGSASMSEMALGRRLRTAREGCLWVALDGASHFSRVVRSPWPLFPVLKLLLKLIWASVRTGEVHGEFRRRKQGDQLHPTSLTPPEW